MRTTVDLDEDLLRVAKELARESGSSLGQAISGLMRRGLEPPARKSSAKGGIPVFPRLPGAKPVTSEMVKELLQSED